MKPNELEKIHEHINRTVTQIAREHGVTDDVVWKQMLLTSVEHTKTNKMEVI